MSWTFYSAVGAFERYRERWDEINRIQGNHVLLDSDFVAPLVRYFAGAKTILGICEDRKRPAMTLIEPVRVGFWRTFQPAQGPLGSILFAQQTDIEQQLVGLMRSLPRYPLGFSIMQQDPDFTACGNVLSSPRFEPVHYITTSRIVVDGGFEDYWESRGRYFVDDLRRQTRRLEERGIQMEFVSERDPGRVAEYIRDYARLEATGWKGREGTSVTADNQQGLFYRDVMENFCRRNEGVIYRLLFNGKVVASDLCLERQGMTIVLKIAYDESIKGISAGKFIHREILKEIFSAGKTKSFEWYGRIHEWQEKLGSVPRTMFHLNIYRNELVPLARHFIKTTRQIFHRNADQ
jgi:hypothetical protein